MAKHGQAWPPPLKSPAPARGPVDGGAPRRPPGEAATAGVGPTRPHAAGQGGQPVLWASGYLQPGVSAAPATSAAQCPAVPPRPGRKYFAIIFRSPGWVRKFAGAAALHLVAPAGAGQNAPGVRRGVSLRTIHLLHSHRGGGADAVVVTLGDAVTANSVTRPEAARGRLGWATRGSLRLRHTVKCSPWNPRGIQGKSKKRQHFYRWPLNFCRHTRGPSLTNAIYDNTSVKRLG